MKKQLKRQLLELTGLLNEAHDFVKKVWSEVNVSSQT